MRYDTDMLLKDMLSDPRCIAILEKHLPGLLPKIQANPMSASMSLKMLAKYAKGMIPEQTLSVIDTALEALNDGSLTRKEKEKIAAYRALYLADQQQKPCRLPHRQEAIYPGKPWLDTAGKPIQAHGGAVIYENGAYYWYGENKEHTDGKSDIWTWGIRCYRSNDLCNWEDLGLIIPPELENPDANLFPDKRIDRPHIVKSAVTQKFVCWIKLSGAAGCFVILTADAITGPYQVVRENYRPFDHEVGDFDLYTDETTGQTYLFETANHDGVYGFLLTDDCLEAKEQVSIQYKGLKPPLTREGVALFEANGNKYMFTSGMTGYLPNPSDAAVAADWNAPFVSLGSPHRNDASGASFNSQISKVFRIAGTEQWIAMADRWVPESLLDAQMADQIARVIGSSSDPEKYAASAKEREEVMALPGMNDSGLNTAAADYVWLPVRFENGKPMIEWLDAWKPVTE